jgi:signal peptidase II
MGLSGGHQNQNSEKTIAGKQFSLLDLLLSLCIFAAMTLVRKLFTFPRPFRSVFPPLWLATFSLLVTIDIVSKKIVTDHLNFNLTYHQLMHVKDVPLHALVDGMPDIPILGENGNLIRFRLVFNDRFVFGSGPSAPVAGIYLTAAAILFLFFYRWKNEASGHSAAWLLVFSGAVGNLIDKLFVKSVTTREWVFSPGGPQPGHVSGVVDFVECIWFGWSQFEDVWGLSWLSWPSWPTFNIADSLIVAGIGLLILTMYSEERRAQQASRQKQQA